MVLRFAAGNSRVNAARSSDRTSRASSQPSNQATKQPSNQQSHSQHARTGAATGARGHASERTAGPRNCAVAVVSLLLSISMLHSTDKITCGVRGTRVSQRLRYTGTVSCTDTDRRAHVPRRGADLPRRQRLAAGLGHSTHGRREPANREEARARPRASVPTEGYNLRTTVRGRTTATQRRHGATTQ